MRGGVETELSTALQFIFATVPALVSYSDETGGPVTVSYPVAAPQPGGSGGGPGTEGNEFPVSDGPDADGDIELTVTFWRPQRRPIAGELCPPPEGRLCGADEWIDIGGLAYSTIMQHVGALPGGTTVQKPCPQSSFSTTDQSLTPTPSAGPSPGFTDLAADRLASPANTLTYTLNLRQCLASLGVPWNSEQPELSVDFTANVTQPGVGAGATQSMWFKRQ